MIEPMPTRDGDVVVSHSGTEYALWHVENDLQQTPGPSTQVSTAHGRLAALKLAKTMARESRGVIILLEQDTLSWKKLSL